MRAGFRYWFQYHAGSIKRVPSDAAGHEPEKRFNTTLVRLKVDARYCSLLYVSMFQYHAGSIKRQSRQNRHFSPRILFQYHAGSIKRLIYEGLHSKEVADVSIPRWFD